MFSNKKWLEQAIKKLSKRITNNQHPYMDNDTLYFLENNIDVVYLILNNLIKIKESQSDKKNAYLLCFCEILAYLNYAVEQERPWAKKFSQELQTYIATDILVPETNNSILFSILDVLHQSGLQIENAILQANESLLNEVYKDKSFDNIEELLEEVAQASFECEFELFENLFSQTYQLVPVEVQTVMATEMAVAESVTLKNTAVLMLLHPESQVRQQAAVSLLSSPRSITPISLRRLIYMRNWLPENEKEHIDALIKQARKHSIECAQPPETVIKKLTATSFDGSGAQSIVAIAKINKTYCLAGIVLKESKGVIDPILYKSDNYNDVTSIMQEMLADTPKLSISNAYLAPVIMSFLSINLDVHIPPSPLLLFFCEIMSISFCPAEKLDIDVAIKSLAVEAKLPKINSKPSLEVLAKSQQYFDKFHYLDTWFEQDSESDYLIATMFKQHANTETIDIALVIAEACSTLFEARRDKYKSRLFWMALWAQANANKQGPEWQNILIIAAALNSKMPLIEIPLMYAIAEETVYIAAEELIHNDESKGSE